MNHCKCPPLTRFVTQHPGGLILTSVLRVDSSTFVINKITLFSCMQAIWYFLGHKKAGSLWLFSLISKEEIFINFLLLIQLFCSLTMLPIVNYPKGRSYRMDRNTCIHLLSGLNCLKIFRSALAIVKLKRSDP